MWLLRKLRNNKEYTPSPTERVRAEPIAVDASFDLAASLASAEEEGIGLILQQPPLAPALPSSSPSSSLPSALTTSLPYAHQATSTQSSASPSSLQTSIGKRTEPPDGRPVNYRHAKRARQREAKIAAEGHKPAPGSTSKLLGASDTGITTSILTAALPAAFGGYMAKPGAREEGWNKTYTLKDIMDKGLRLIKWDGIIPRPLYDANGFIFAVLAGRPRDDSYVEDAHRAFDVMRALAEAEKWKEEELLPHRRGAFIAHNVGISGGKGTPRPIRLSVGTHAYLTEQLLGNKALQRMATFGSSAFQRWSPKLFAYYKEHMDALRHHDPHLGWNYEKSVFPCAAFNMSKRVVSWWHRDSANLPFGWCSITSIAKKGFRPHLGGHIILWELGLVIEFPHASTILIPSATVTHSNTALADGDERLSFTQFAAGALFRYVDNGFRSDKQVYNRDRKEFRRLEELKTTRWENGLALYSKLDDLLVQTQE